MFNVESTKAVVLTPFNSFTSLTPFFKKTPYLLKNLRLNSFLR